MGWQGGPQGQLQGFSRELLRAGGQTVSILPSLYQMTHLVASSLCN